MSTLSDTLSALRRPRLLVRAARAGLPDYVRHRDLPRLTEGRDEPSPVEAVRQLLDQETRLEATRREGSAAYCVTRHVDVLIALMSEARAVTST